MLHNCLLFLSLAISVYVKNYFKKWIYTLFIKIQCKYIQNAIQHGKKKDETPIKQLNHSTFKMNF